MDAAGGKGHQQQLYKIKYEYYKNGGQIYPDKITYTGNNTTDGIFIVNFVRGSRTDTVKSYKTGFLVQSNSRITEINTTVSSTWVRKYALSYTTGDNGVRSLLSSIAESGRNEDGTGSIDLPATSFQYQTSTVGWDLDTSTWTAPEPIDENRNFLDLSGDSYIDFIYSYGNPPSSLNQSTFLNTGNFTWSSNSSLAPPILFQKYEIRGGAYADNWDQGVRLADVNGDQFADIIQGLDVYNGSPTYDAYLNTGTNWSQTSTWNPTITFSMASSNNNGGSMTDYGARVLELNGDGLPDITRQTDLDGGYNDSQLNTGSGFASVVSTWDTSIVYRSPWIHHPDLNNDGLSDIIYNYFNTSTQSEEKLTYLNNGGGWTEESALEAPMQFSHSGQADWGVWFMDVNGDNLPDAVIDPYYENSEQHTYLNTGIGWTAASSWNLPMQDTYLLNGITHAGDFNQDTLLDFFETQNSSPTVTKVWKHKGVKPDLLKKITYPASGFTDITYKASAQYKNGSTLLNPNLPYNLMTVESISHNSNFGVTASYTFTYEGGKYYFNTALDRKLAGFHKVTRTDSAGNKQITYFHQGDTTNSGQGEYSDHSSKIGKPYRVEHLDSSNNKYAVIINKWDKYNQGTDRDFVKLVQAITMTYDGDSDHRDKAETFTYDDSTGDLTQKVEWGEVTGADGGTFTDTGSDKFTTDISYAANATAYIYLPKTETVTDQSANKVRESKYYYDAQSHGTVTDGNLTKQEKWKSGSTYINTQKAYNTTYGIVTSDTDPRGKVTSYTYDSYNLYPATVSQPHSLSTSYTYDYSSGKVKQTTDPNNLVFQTVYDGLDRVVEEKQPDLTTPSTLVTKTAYVYTNTSGAVSVKQTDHLDGSISVETHTYFDGFNRPIQVRREMEDTNTFAVQDTVYNNVEQVHKESLPYASTGSARTSATTTSDLLTTYAYDPVLRVMSIQNAVGTISNTYDDWKTTVTDARGKPKHLYKDAYGNLTNITDALSNVRNFTYDGLSRRLTAQDLHASSDSTYGTWTYTYDDSGNLTQSVDPKSQTVNYTYDDINRQLTEDYTGITGTEITYAYDSCTYGKPRLCSVSKSDGVNTAFTYNANGGVASEVKTIQATDYTTSYTYDRQGNQLEITNPGDWKTKYTYNTAGLPETVQRKKSGGSFVNVVSDFDYGPHGKVTYRANNNSTATTNTYDATKLYRLSSKVTAISSAELQNLAYTYDSNGNITKIIDSSDTNSAKTVDYTYDDLNRLLTATSSNVATGQNYTQTFTYSAIGNITSGDAGTYSYNGSSGSNYANPHAVTDISGTTYSYDNNGNLTQVSGESLDWYSGGGSSTITLDATTTNISNGYNGGPTTKNWSHTTSSGSNRLLVLSADIWQDVGGTGTITSATYNGVNLTKATNTRSGGMATEVWYLVAPATGSNTVSVTVTGATDSIKLSVSTFKGVDQTNAYVASNTATGTTGNPSVSITTTEANSLLLATLSRFSTTSATTNRTSLYNDATGSTLGASSYQITTTTGSYSDTYTGSSNNDWSMIASEFKPSTGSGGGTWTNRKQLTIDHTKVSGSSNLSNFTALVSLTDNSLKTVANGGYVGKSDGTDILFTSSDGTTKLSHEIEKYDGSTGTLIAWVKIPTLSYTADTALIIYFGNSSASDQQDKPNAWDSNTVSVWHLKEDPTGTAPQMKESTSNSYHGTSNGSQVAGDSQTGKIGNALNFDGTDDYENIGSAANINSLTNNLTVSGWIKPSSVSGGHRMVSASRATSANGFGFGTLGTEFRFTTWGVKDYDSSGASIANNTWQKIDAVMNSNNVTFYLNGVNKGTINHTTGGNTNTDDNFFIGTGTSDGSSSLLGQFQGLIDEVKISNTPRTSGWITTEYNNQNSPSTFMSFGDVPSGSSLTNTWNYQNRLTRTVIGSMTVTYDYDHINTTT